MFGFINHKISDLNEFFQCKLCKGYLIDATTVIECMHSFCKTCIMKHLEDDNCCPFCNCQLHETKPYLDVRNDKVLQAIVYQLFPAVFNNEMKRRRDFHAKYQESSRLCQLSPEKRGEIPPESYSGLEDDLISIELCNWENRLHQMEKPIKSPIYLLCPSIITVEQLKKLLSQKLQIDNFDLSHLSIFIKENDHLDDKYSLNDIQCCYLINRQRPLTLFFSYSIENATSCRLIHINKTEYCFQKRQKSHPNGAPTNSQKNFMENRLTSSIKPNNCHF